MTAQTTRRAMLGALAIPVVIAAGGAALASPSQDDAILTAWEARQRALALAMQNGPYVAMEIHSPDLAEIYDQADNRIVTTEAQTIRGALYQAWVHLSYVGTEFTRESRRIGDLVRAADFAALEREPDLDWEYVTGLRVIRTLRALAGEV